MRIRFRKLSNERHRLEVERAGGAESVELETRSTLFHDLTHFAVEECAGLDAGFFGGLAAGESLSDLADEARFSDDRMRIERAVVVLQGLPKRDEDPATLFRRIEELASIQDAELPGWFTEDLVRCVRSRLREFVGHWRVIPPGEALELRWRA